MKKIFVLLMGLMFVFQVNALAAVVSKSDDPFEGDYSVFTTNTEPGPLKYIEFEKKVYPTYKKYEMQVTMPYFWHRDDDYFVKEVQIKVDDQIYQLKILKQHKYEYDNTDNIEFWSEVPVQAADAVATAGHIMVRVIDSRDEKRIVDFPIKDINKWKDVISTEE